MHHCPHLLFVYRRVPFCLTVPYNVQCATRADCYVFVRVIRNDICEQMSFFENDIICVSVFYQERERRRQHMILMKAVEARKKAEVSNC